MKYYNRGNRFFWVDITRILRAMPLCDWRQYFDYQDYKQEKFQLYLGFLEADKKIRGSTELWAKSGYVSEVTEMSSFTYNLVLMVLWWISYIVVFTGYSLKDFIEEIIQRVSGEVLSPEQVSSLTESANKKREEGYYA